MSLSVKWSKYIPADKKPTPKQLAFLSLPHQEAFYGGAAGGGKSECLLMGALAWCDTPGFSGIIFRRQYTDMLLPSSILSRCKEWLQPFIKSKEVKYDKGTHSFLFPSGAKLAFGYLKTEGVKNRYASSEYHYIAFDELTHFLEDEYTFLFSRQRKTTDTAHIPLKMRSACVDEGDVLTLGGWKDIKDIHVGDLIYSPNSYGVLQLKPVTHVHKYAYSGKLVRVNKKNLYMSITPNHRVMYKKFGKDTYDLKEFNLHNGKCISICRTSEDAEFGAGITNEFGWDNLDFMKFIGIYLSDGSVNHSGRGHKVNITQCKGKYIPTIQSLLDASPFKFCRCKNGDWQTCRKALHAYLKPLGKSHQKYVPRDLIQNGTKEEIQALFDWLVMGDGSRRKNSITYNTCSPQLAKDVEELGIRLGYKVQTDFQVLDNPKHNDRYVIYLTKNDTTTKVDKNPGKRNDISYDNYTGFVYCISVADNESFVIKQRGKVWLSGNSNPGALGHLWVKKRFGITKDITTGEFYGTNPDAPFVSARVMDNPYIDQSYMHTLDKLGKVERERLKNGDWDVSDQALFDSAWFMNRWTCKSNGLNTWYHLLTHEGRRVIPDGEITVFSTVDCAASIKTGVKTTTYIKDRQPSWSVIATWGLTRTYDLMLLDIWRAQVSIPDLVNAIEDNQRKWHPLYNIIEKNGPGEGVYQNALIRGLPCKPIHSPVDKVKNSIAAQLRAEDGKVWLPAFKPWLKDLEDELFSWTGAQNQTDDQIDVLSNACNEAMELAVGYEQDMALRSGLRRAVPVATIGGLRSNKGSVGGRERLRTGNYRITSGVRNFCEGLKYLR